MSEKLKPTAGAPQQKMHISSVDFSPMVLRAGQTVKVTVLAQPLNSLNISINGVPGSVQYVVWDSPGKKRVFITGVTDAGKIVERRTEIIEIHEAVPDYPKFEIERLIESPTTLLFAVVIPSHKPRGTTGTINSFSGVHKPRPNKKKGTGKARSLLGTMTPPPVFEWDFGKGFVVGTKSGSFAHDFGPDLNESTERQSFHVAVRVIVPNKPAIEIRRTVSVFNTYAAGKKRGFLLLPSQHDLNARFENGRFHGKLTVTNPENFKIILDSRRVEVFFANGERSSLWHAVESVNQVINPKAETVFNAHVNLNQVPKDAVGFAVHYGGIANNLVVRVSAYFDIPGRWWQASQLVPSGLQKLLRSVANRRMIPNPKQITYRDLETLAQRGEFNLSHLRLNTAKLNKIVIEKPGVTTLSDHSEPLFAVEGEECDPTNLPDDISENLVCQATSETKYVAMPGRFMNAKRGDAVLSPGGTGLIGGLLRHVHPPQNYSHSGIMTRNHDEITHATASEDRMLAYPVGSFAGEDAPTDGHRPDVLKYLWPGTITQTVEEAVHGESYKDPESGKEYTISGFDPNNKKIPDTWELIPPLVVKPDPMLETPEHRKRLRKAANFAVDQKDHSHYRFYCYTDPTIGLDAAAPGEAGWASGTRATVCSSLVWMSLRSAGFTFEGGQIEQKDKDKGAEFGPDHEDGLYKYTAEERLIAGEWLYNALYDMVVEQAQIQGPEGLITAFTDMPDDVSNQILNTFASDWSDIDAKDSEAWKSTVDARAVSPDNILFWDSPDKNGPYGYSETLVYRPPRYELVTVHKWKKVVHTGTIKGLIRFKSQPVIGAQAEVYDGMFTASGNDGRFTLLKVPAGDYILKVSKLQDGLYLSKDVPVTVKKDDDTDINIDLEPPDDSYRAVTIDGEMFTLDDEWTLNAKPILANPHSYKGLFAVLRVGIFDTHDETTFSDVVDGDVRSEFHIEADWQLNKSVTLSFTLRIFETADPADGIDSEVSASFNLPAGQAGYWGGMKVYNDDEDFAVVEFHAKNEMQIT